MKALLLDYDGVILETEELHRRAINSILSSHNYHIAELEWSNSFIGRRSKDIIRDCLKGKISENELDKLVRKKREYFLVELTKTQIKSRPGIRELISAAQDLNIVISIVSSSSREEVDLALKKLKLEESIHSIWTVDQVTNPKPSPDIYNAILARLQIHNLDAIAIEDSPVGIKAAKAAGVYCVAYPNRFTKDLDLSSADVIMHKLDHKTLLRLLTKSRDL